MSNFTEYRGESAQALRKPYIQLKEASEKAHAMKAHAMSCWPMFPPHIKSCSRLYN